MEYNKEALELIEELGSSLRGLSALEVDNRLKINGKNVLSSKNSYVYLNDKKWNAFYNM